MTSEKPEEQALTKPDDRTLVIVVGGCYLDTAPFEERRLGIRRVDERGARDLFRTARALIVAEPTKKLGRIQRYFTSLLPLAEQHGLVLRILVGSSKDVRSTEDVAKLNLIRDIKAKKSGSCWSVKTVYEDQVNDAAETIRREYVGPQQVQTAHIECHRIGREHKVLLRRAFFDCTKVRLERLHGGKASDSVFLAYAFGGPLLARRPLPFFVKFAAVEAIRRERGFYKDLAQPYVPFHLRPNLDHRRCVRGSRISALVGNLVEDAMPLREALQKGVGGGILFGLFENTLRGFRIQPFAEGGIKKEAGLDTFVEQVIRIKDLEKRKDVIVEAKKFRLKSTPAELQQTLLEHAKNISYWEAPMHGDLHDGNVMVRRTDPIVIDFGNIKWGPLTADPATLEVSLVFRTDYKDDCSFSEWKKFVDAAYASLGSLGPLNPEAEPTTLTWLHRAIREIRHVPFGCDCVHKEVAIVLAAYLMRFARLDIEDVKTAQLERRALKRHAYALIVAERVINEMINSESAH